MPLILPPPAQNPGIAGQIGQNVLAFLQTRLAMQQEQKKHQQEQEDRDLAQKMLKLQMDRLKVEKLNAERDAAQRQAKNQIDTLTGAPAPVGDISNGVLGVRGGEMPDLFKRFEIASGRAPNILLHRIEVPSGEAPAALTIPRLDTSGMQAIGRHPQIAMPGAEGAAPVMVRPPSQEELQAAAQQKAQLDLANLFNKTIVETTARRQAEAANPVTKDLTPYEKEMLNQRTLDRQQRAADSAASRATQRELRGQMLRLQDMPEDEQKIVDDLAERVASGEATPETARGLLGGVSGKRGMALAEAIASKNARIVPVKIREGLTDLNRTKNLVEEIRALVTEIQSSSDPQVRAEKSILLENYTQSVGTMLARGFGERGVVTDADRKAATGLVPGWKSANFAPGFAMEKMKILDEMIARNQKALTENFFDKLPKPGARTGNRPPLESFVK